MDSYMPCAAVALTSKYSCFDYPSWSPWTQCRLNAETAKGKNPSGSSQEVKDFEKRCDTLGALINMCWHSRHEHHRRVVVGECPVWLVGFVGSLCRSVRDI